MAALTFDSFLNERWSAGLPKEKRLAAGVAIIYDNKILLVHPTNSTWRKGTCGIPKGKVDNGENIVEAALRELEEETGISLSPTQLDPDQEKVHFYNHKGEIDGHLIYFICKINDLSEIGLTDLRVPKSQLQLEEIDWAKFVSAEEAYPITSRYQLIILDRHLSLNK